MNHNHTGKRVLPLLAAAVLLLASCGRADENEVVRSRDAGISAMTEGNYAEAVRAFDRALENTGLTVTNIAIDINYYKAAAQYLDGDFRGALKTYGGLIEYDKKSCAPYFLRGCIYADEREKDNAVADFRQAIQAPDADYDLYIEIYNQLSSLGYNEDALTFLNLGLEAEGSGVESDIGRGRIYILLNQYEPAIKALNSAADRGASLAELYLAEAYDRQGEKEQAAEHIEKYANSEDVTSESLNALGMLQMENKEYAEALTTFEKALSLENITNEKDLLRNEIAALEYNGQFTDAYIKAQDFVRVYPNEQDMQRELVFLLTRFEGPYRPGEEEPEETAEEAAPSEAAPEGAENAGESAPSGDAAAAQ